MLHYIKKMLHKMLHYIKCNVRSDVTFYAADPRRGFFYVITAEYLSVAAFDIFWSFGQLCERADGLLSLSFLEH